MWQGDGAPALMQMMQKGDDLLSSLAHALGSLTCALGLPEKSTGMPSSAGRAADTGSHGCGRNAPGPTADVAGASPVPVQMW